MHDSDNLIAYYWCNKIDDKWKGKPLAAAEQQKRAKIAGHKTMIGGINLYGIKAKICKAHLLHDASPGGISKKQIEKVHKRNEGFVIEYCNIDLHQTFS